MATTEFKVPYGKLDGRIVSIDDVPRKTRGVKCPGCEAELVVRKGDERRHHFAHPSAGNGCGGGGEGYLHETVKLLMAERIRGAMEDEAPVRIKWSCKKTKCSHEDDILCKWELTNIRVEKRLPKGNIKPDITLMAGDKPKALVEVVDAHEPEQPVIDTGLPVLEVHAYERALDELANREIPIPVAFMHNLPCPDPICVHCGRRASVGCDTIRTASHDFSSSSMKTVKLYSSGMSGGNPGLNLDPGGYATTLLFSRKRVELSGGYRDTTIPRMHLNAIIAGLETLKEKHSITIYSNHKYVLNSLSEGWAEGWRANGWRLPSGGVAKNHDLWERLLELWEAHDNHHQRVEGPSDIEEQELCDTRAKEAASKPDLPLTKDMKGVSRDHTQ